MKIKILTGAIAIGLVMAATAKEVRYSLHVNEKTIQPAGKKVTALALNGSIPGPTLRFKVGDTAKITVTNGLKKQQAS